MINGILCWGIMKNLILRYRKILFPAVTLLVSLGCTLVGTEFALRYLEQRLMHNEPDLNRVISNEFGAGGILKKNVDENVMDSFGNKVSWINNSDGFRSDKEYSQKPDPSTLRILSLGDSFTSGYRIGQDETFSFLMEKWIERKFGKAEVMIAWTEQPGRVLNYMEEFGQHYHPDAVFLGITMSNDITSNYSTKPGLNYWDDLHSWEVSNDCLIKRNLLEDVKWSAIFIYSRLRFVGLFYDQPRAVSSRHKAYIKPKLFDTDHALGYFLKAPPPVVDEAYDYLFFKILELKKFLDARNIDLIVSIFPQRFQVALKDWESAVYQYGLKESCFDRMRPNKLFNVFCAKNDVFCIDGTPMLKQIHMRDKAQLYQPRGDTHWNALGNKMFFESIRPSLQNYLEEYKGKYWSYLTVSP